MDGAVYDLLMGHEVSHALHTPHDGWHSNVSEHGQGFKSVLNVVEDARIEKKIKRKYPGLSKSFAAAYASLYERDFFGIKDFKDLSKLNLADRINLYFKLGHLMYVPFSDEERVIVNEVANLDTWEQVVDVSHRIYGVMKENKDDTITNPADFDLERQDQQQQEDDGGDVESDEFEQNDDSEESEDADWVDGSSPVSNQKNGSDEESATSSPTSGGSGPSDDVESVTDRIFRNREHELVVSSQDWVVNMELPTPNLDKIIMPFKYMVNGWAELRASVDRRHVSMPKIFGTSSQMVEDANKTFRAKNNSVINSLVKEFEMRKNAARYARQKTARSGDLDMNRLHAYKLSNDIFKRMTIVPNGKNHGMMMIVDFSGSMSGILEETLEQVMILATFCRRVNIPFDVYAFCDDAVHGTKMQREWLFNRKPAGHWSNPGYVNTLWNYDNSVIQMTEDGFHLKHLIGSSLSKGDYAVASEMLTTLACYHGTLYAGGYPRQGRVRVGLFDSGRGVSNLSDFGFGLGGTPLVEAILATRSMIERFKAAHRLDVVNVIHLTDGCGGGAWSYQNSPSDNRYWDTPKVVYITDPITKRRMTVSGNRSTHNCQAAMTTFVRELTGCKHIGYYMVGGRFSRSGLSNFVGHSTFTEEMWNSWRNDGFFAIENQGFDSYFYLNVKPIADEFKVEDGASKSVLKKSFAKYMNGKRSNRALTVRFAKEIAA
jgi:hypothetical protein